MANEIYKFLKDNNLTQKDEAAFLADYSTPEKVGELYKFMQDNQLTQKTQEEFANNYFPASVQKKSPVITSEASNTSSTVSPPVSQPSVQSGPEKVEKAPLSLLEEANALFNRKSNDEIAIEAFEQGQRPKQNLHLKSGERYAFEKRLFSKVNDANSLRERAANKYLEVQKNQMFPQLKRLEELKKLRAEAMVGRGVAGAGVDNLEVLQQEIDKLEKSPVNEVMYGVNSNGQELKVQSPHKTVGELADATQHAKEEFGRSVKDYQAINAEVQPIIDTYQKAKGFIPNKTDANGNHYYEQNALESFMGSLSSTADIMAIGLKNLSGDKDGAIADMQKRYVIDNVLEPRRPDSYLAKGTGMLGGVAPLIIGGAASGGGLGALAMSALLFGAQDYGGSLYSSYTEGKAKGMSDEQAMEEANKNAAFAGGKGILLGATLPGQGALGRRIFLNGAEAGAFKNFLADQSIMIPAFGSSTAIQNWYEGKPIGNNVDHAMVDAFIVGSMMHVLPALPNLPQKTRETFENVLAKNFEDLNGVINKAVEEGAMDFATAQTIAEKSKAFDLIGRNNPPEIQEELLKTGERLNLLNTEAQRIKEKNPNADLTEFQAEIEARKKDILETKGAPLTIAEQKSYDRLIEKSTKKAGEEGPAPELLPGEKEELRSFQARIDQRVKLDAIEAKRAEEDAAAKAAASAPEPANITIKEAMGLPVSFRGRRATITTDGDMVIARSGNREYEIGNIQYVGDHSIKDYGMEQQQSVVSTNERGNLLVRGKEYFNNYSNPLSAINYDKDGNVVSVNMETANGTKRAFRGDVAEDAAYQLTLKELEKRNEIPELENFINDEPTIKQEVDDARLNAPAEEPTTESNEPLPREKADRLDRTGETVGISGGERTDGNDGVNKESDAGGKSDIGAGNVEGTGSDVSKEPGSEQIPDAKGAETGAIEGAVIVADPKYVRDLASEAKMSDAELSALSKEITGTEILEDLDPDQLDNIGNAILEKAVDKEMKAVEDNGEKKEVENFINQDEEVRQMIEANRAERDKIGSASYKAAKHPQGRTITKTVADGSKLKGTYKLVSADDVLASHNEKTFAQTPGYPETKSGSTINDRDYARDTNAQKEVARIAQGLDDRAITQTPVVTKDGIVVDGNNRTMSRKLAAANGTDKAYVEALKDQAELYGFKPEDVDGIKNPMLVFEPVEDLPYDTKTLAKFNKAEKKEKSPVERAVEVAKTISDRARRRLGDIYSEADVPSDVTSNPKSVKEVVKLLQEENILQPNELPRYFDVDKLTATKEGVAFMESLLMGGALDEKAIRLLDNENMGSVRQKLLKAIVPLTQNAALGENSLTKDIEGAIGLVNKSKQEKSSVVDAVRQMDMFSTSKFSPEELALAIMLDSEGFGKFLKDYNENVGKEVLFEGTLTKDKIIDNALRQKIDSYEKIRPNLRSNAAESTGKVSEGDGGGKSETGTGKGKTEPTKEVSEREKAKAERIAAKKNLKDFEGSLGIMPDPKEHARLMYEYHRALVVEAKAYIKETANKALHTVKDFAESIGEKVEDVRRAWDEAMGNTEPATIDDFSTKEGAARAMAEAEGGGEKVKKTVVTKRAYEGQFRKEVKQKLKDSGLEREVQNQAKAERAAKKFVEEVGIGPALDAVKNGDVKGAPAAVIWNAAIESVNKKILVEKNPAKLEELSKLQSELMQAFGQEATYGGQFNAMLDRIYGTSELGYNAEAQIKKYKDVNGGEIPADLEKRFREIEQELKEVRQKYAEAEERAKWKEAQTQVDNIVESITREKKTRSARHKKADDLLAEGLDELADALGITKKAFGTERPSASLALEKIGRALIEKGHATLEDVVDKIRDVVKDKLGDKVKFEDYEEDLKAAFRPESAKATMKDGKLVIPHALIRAGVEEGHRTAESLTAFVKEAIKEDFPDVSDREVRDAISGYGKVVNPSGDEIEADIRKIKRISRDLSKLEDIGNKKRPLRSGRQRDAMDAEERALAKKVREAMKELPLDAETAAKELKTSLDGIKSRLKNQIEDYERAIKEGEKIDKSDKSVPYDAEANALKAERDALKEDYEEIFGKNELSDAQKLERAERAAERSLERIDERIRNNEVEVKKTKGPESQKLRDLREQLEERKKVMQEMRDAAGITDKKRLEAAKRNVQRRMETLKERMRTGDFSPKKPKPIIEDSELTDLKSKKIALEEEYDKAHYKNELANRTKWEKAEDAALEFVSGLPRALVASIDLSPMGVQGGLRLLTSPKQSIKSAGEMFKSLASEKYHDEWIRKVKAQPWYQDFKDAGGHLSEHDSRVNAREDRFISNWVNHVWNLPGKGIGLLHEGAGLRWQAINPYKASERAYNGYMNALRVQGYLEGAKKLESMGMTFETHPEAYEAWTDYINSATGRGSLGRFEQASKLLNFTLFSPRRLAGLLKLSSPYALIYYGKMYSKSPEAAKMAMGDFAKFAVLAGIATALGKLAGADVETDSNSSDFMKLRFGNSRVNFFGGMLPQIVLMSRMWSGNTKSSTTDKVSKLGGKFGSETRWDKLIDYFANKFSPPASLAKRALDQSKGRELDAEDEALRAVTPMWTQSIKELYNSHSAPVASLLTLMSIFGLPVESYETKKKHHINDSSSPGFDLKNLPKLGTGGLDTPKPDLKNFKSP